VDHQILELANTVAARVKALATGVSVLGLLNSPPANPSPGTYLIDEHPTGIWATRPGDVAIWDGGQWTYYHHPAGDVVIFEVANGNAYRWDGSRYILAAHVARVTAGPRYPDLPQDKDLHWLTPEKVLYIYDGGRWDASSPSSQATGSGLPPGDQDLAVPIWDGSSMSWLTSGRYLADDGTNPFQLPEADQKTVYPSTYDIVEYTNALRPPAAGGVPPVEVLGVIDRPPSPIQSWLDGEKYLVSSTPFANGFSGMGDWVVVRDTSEGLGWRFESPGRPGTVYHVKPTNEFKVWTGHGYASKWEAPTIFVTDETISGQIVGDIRFVSIPENHIELWNGSRWTRVTHGLYYQNTPPELPAHDVHDNDLWYDPDTRQFGIASGGHWHQTDIVIPQQVGGTVWSGQHLAAGHSSIWWKQGLKHFEPWIYDGVEWVPATPPQPEAYVPPKTMSVLIERQTIGINGQVTPPIDLRQGQIGRIHVDLATTTIKRPKIVFYTSLGRIAPSFSFINDEILGSGTGDGTQWHAASVRFGSAVPHVDGTQLRVENANNDSNRDDDYTNQLQLSYTLEYSFMRNSQDVDVLRMTLIGTAGTQTAGDKALPIRVHANFMIDGDITAFCVSHEHNKFIALMTHTLLGG
jgi:hypothetical protein